MYEVKKRAQAMHILKDVQLPIPKLLVQQVRPLCPVLWKTATNT